MGGDSFVSKYYFRIYFTLVFGIWLLKQDKRIGFAIMPFSALPYNLGLFALIGCTLIYIISNTKLNPL